MGTDTREFAEIWGAPTCAVAVPAERYEQFRDAVPELLLTFWREFGFSGFGAGLFWICDPVAWQPAIDAWTRDLAVPLGDDRWLAVSRTAFGRMQLWGQRTGMSLTVTPWRGWILPTDQSGRMSSSDERDDQIYAALTAQDRQSADVVGDDGRPLFDRVRASKGPVGPDTVYGFVPALALGGPVRPESVEIVNAPAHLELLSDVTPRRVIPDIR